MGIYTYRHTHRPAEMGDFIVQINARVMVRSKQFHQVTHGQAEHDIIILWERLFQRVKH